MRAAARGVIAVFGRSWGHMGSSRRSIGGWDPMKERRLFGGREDLQGLLASECVWHACHPTLAWLLGCASRAVTLSQKHTARAVEKSRQSAALMYNIRHQRTILVLLQAAYLGHYYNAHNAAPLGCFCGYICTFLAFPLRQLQGCEYNCQLRQ